MLCKHARNVKKDVLHYYNGFTKPIENIIPDTPVLESKGNRPLKMTFKDQIKALIYYRLKEFKSGRHLLQVL